MNKMIAFLMLLLPAFASAAETSGQSQGSELRYDGIYQSGRRESNGTAYWSYLRFYPDGTVLTVHSTGRPDQLKKWFSKDHTGVSRGTVKRDGNSITFSAVSQEGTVDYSGDIEGDQLHLDRHSHINDFKGSDRYAFVGWGEKPDTAPAPDLSGTGLRFDGVYQSTPKKAGSGSGYWGYLRFYQDGTVVDVSTTGRPDEIRDWFNRDHPRVSRGKVTAQGEQISFASVSAEGTVDYSGRVEGGKLHMDTHSHINQHKANTVYTFVEWPQEQEGFVGTWLEYWPGIPQHATHNITKKEGRYKVEGSSPLTKKYQISNVRMEGGALKFDEGTAAFTVKYEVRFSDPKTLSVRAKGMKGWRDDIVWKRVD
jgi:hypothetical protein